MLALNAGQVWTSKIPNLQPAKFVQLGIVQSEILDSFEEAIALDVARHYCTDCGYETSPVQVVDDGEDSIWILFPCHQIYCDSCLEVEDSQCSTCYVCQDCCDCWHCEACETMVKPNDSQPCSNCGYCDAGCCECYWCSGCDYPHSADWHCGECDRCESCCTCQQREHCSCSDCVGTVSSSGAVVPGWIQRGDPLPSSNGDASALMAEHLSMVDPVQSMADFYLLDLVLMILPNGSALNLHNPGLAVAARIRNDAKRLQRGIVARCDDAFRDYGFLAIGGELRHHRYIQNNGGLPSSRSSANDYWQAMGETMSRATLLHDARLLFGDRWTAGYGGRAWLGCTDVLLARERGELDAKTFVDRVFSLQHNGGSFLNKFSWAQKTNDRWSVSYCQSIGNAHAARETDYRTLLGCASPDVQDLCGLLVQRCSSWFGPSRLHGRPDRTAVLCGLKRALGVQCGPHCSQCDTGCETTF